MKYRIAAVATAAALAACQTGPEGADTFTVGGVLAGSIMTREMCKSPESSVYVTVEGRGECIRYFAGGLASDNPIAVVNFHGDRLWRDWNHNGETISRRVFAYRDATAYGLSLHAESMAENMGLPYIRVSRPGTYGSSGDHDNRRQPRNLAIIEAALKAIKRKHSIERFAMTGQSGGGHVVATMLSRRNDIKCAVSTSGVIAVAEKIRIKRWPADATGHRTFLDPMDHVDAIPTDPSRRIFIIGDKRDRNTPFASQKAFFEAVKARGHAAWLLTGEGRGNSYHDLEYMGFRIVSWCANGVPTEEILRRVESGVKELSSREDHVEMVGWT